LTGIKIDKEISESIPHLIHLHITLSLLTTNNVNNVSVDVHCLLRKFGFKYTFMMSVMKRFYLAVLCVLLCHHVFGKIRNGYEQRLEDSRTSLRSLNLLLLEGKNLSPADRLLLKSKIEILVDYLSLYELTEEFIRHFKIVAPIMFTELDNIKDKKGRFTDIYVRLVPEGKSRIPLTAASFFERKADDEDANVSRYGIYSVSVDILIVNKALFLLSHELGHIKYVVPNLAEYTKYYNWRYNSTSDNSYMGHSVNDKSGEQSHIFERRFLDEQKIYFKHGGKKPMPLFTLLAQIRKNTKNRETDYPLLFASNDIR
jgi:hypothetical protein